MSEIIATMEGVNCGVPPNVDRFVSQDSIRKYFACPEAVPPMDDGYMPARTRQVQCILHSSVPAANDNDVSVAEEEAIACRTSAHATTTEIVLTLYVEPARFGTACQDNRTCQNSVCRVVHTDLERLLLEINAQNSGIHKPCIKTCSLVPHELHQSMASCMLPDNSRVVLHIYALAKELTTKYRRHQQRTQSSTRGVGGCGEARWAATNDHHLVHSFRGSRVRAQVGRLLVSLALLLPGLLPALRRLAGLVCTTALQLYMELLHLGLQLLE
mmetsp:Transcript_24779/g.43387  ORF Transcript_24779/g.43387 Transcript_24779/m.43387 type:complete len:271 (-) Transcript_24779:840-1652(-)